MFLWFNIKPIEKTEVGKALIQTADMSDVVYKWDKNALEEDRVHKSCSVAWMWCQPVPVPAALTAYCSGLTGSWLQLRTWPRLFTAPPPLPFTLQPYPCEKSYAVCFEWTAFFFVWPIKTEGKVSQQVA